ncbi:MAG: cytochrome ubiquinol oxidase subunit I [Nitrospinota bacterium]|nr:cytochrome ubiquinol oxidase subunit I [Nitrospinota bacterium]MDH5756446.1 cytochrome ubiquinol oxidase subunit I [Nitrospinota bacterium]
MSNLTVKAGGFGRLMEKTKTGRLFALAGGLFLVAVLAGALAPSYGDGALITGKAWAEEAEGQPAAAAEGEGAVAAEGEEAAVDDNTWKPMPTPKLEAKDYPQLSGIDGRLAVWIAAQLHLFFAAFVLGVPIFVWVIELIGVLSGDKRYDHMAHEFMKVSMTGFSLAASFGGLLSFLLVVFYPDFMEYMTSIFGKTMIIYAVLFFAESFFVYTYYYGWDRMSASSGGKWLHLGLGLGLNGSGMLLMVLSNSWASFMMAPSGIGPEGQFLGDSWAAIHGKLWNPLNLHRFIANIAYGGSLTAAYAAFKFITTESPEEKAHYDWMGYTSFIIAMAGLLPLPFAGYWLTKEVYDYSQQMGITLMGGVFAWLFILQAVLIGAIFLSANYYLWCSLGRTEASKRFYYLIQPMGVVIVISFLIWFTPHTLIMTSKELSQIGGAHHPVLGSLGVMAAKNTAVNILILATFLSFQLFMRSNSKPVGDGFWAKNGLSIQVGLFTAAIINIVFLGIYSYLIPANIRIGLSIPQVSTTAVVCVLGIIIQTLEFKGAKDITSFRWGHMPARSQYALFMLAVSFTWLMGLMGYCRSAIRQHWHVYTVFRDNSPAAYTPTLPYAAWVVTIIVMIFMALVFFMFWMPILAAKKKEEQETGH